MPVRKLLVAAACAALFAVFLGSPPASSSNDAYWSKLWGIRKVGADKAWSVGTGEGSTIAVVDTGVDMTHPDLQANIVPGIDLYSGDGNPSDENGHGTHVSGIAAGIANNGIGIAGVAPSAKIMPVRVLGPDGSGSGSTVDQGIRWAADHHATVINLSLGDGLVFEDLSGGSSSSACDYAWSKGSICVVAAGNDGFFRTEFQNANAIIVTATDPDNTQASYATGPGFAKWGIAAPGGTGDTSDPGSNIFSTYWVKGKSAQYAYLAGTSMATPHVSGAVAILRGLGLTPQQTVDRLMSTATDLGARGNDGTFGHGLLNVAAAVSGLHQTGVSQPRAAGSSPATAAPSGASSGAPAPSSEHAARSATSAKPAASSGTTPSVPNGSLGATNAPGVALFSPAPARHGGGDGWAIGFVLLGLGAAGGLGVLAYRLRGRVS